MKLLYLFLIAVFGCQMTTAQLQSFEPTADYSGQKFGSIVGMNADNIFAGTITSATSPGKLYLFNTNLEQIQSFYPADALIDDRFGGGFSFENNFLAISSPQHDAVGTDTGAVYLYQKNGTGYDFFQKITAADAMPGDYFGSSTKMQDGFLFIAASGDEPDSENNTNRGSVYVYTFNGTQWTMLQKLSTIEPAMQPINIIPTLGGEFFINNDQMKIWSGDYQTNFTLIDGFWVYQSAYQMAYIVGGGSYSIYGMKISDNQSFLMSNGDFAMYLQVRDLTPPNSYQYIDLPPFIDENSYSYYGFDVNDGLLFVGRASNSLQEKRPVMFHKKIGDQWQFQRTLYGNGPDGINDSFGTVLSTASGMAVFGAPDEGLNGKAYFASEAALRNDSFYQNKISVFPNPVHNILNIKNDTADISKVDVYSITGKLLLSVDGNLNEINLENLDSGMYFVKITTQDGNNQSFKIIKN